MDSVVISGVMVYFPKPWGALACPTRQHGNCRIDLTVLLPISEQAGRFCPSMDGN